MSDHLPSEIVEEILHRLPVKSIVKFTTVCKAWNSLIKDKTFIHDHLNRTIDQASNGNNDSIFIHFSYLKDIGQRHLQQKDFYSLYSVDQQTNHLSVERFPFSHLFRHDRYTTFAYTTFAGTCNGLVCYADYSPSDSATILIWNPLLRKYVVLPKPIMTCNKRDRQHYARYDVCFGFGFDSRNNDYKVVRFMNLCFEEDTPHIEVYSLVSRSWKCITIGVPQFYFRYYDRNRLPPVFVNGAIHWVANRHRGDNLEHKFILSFDVTEETFQELMLPQESNHKESIISKLLVVEGGRSLAVSNYRTNTRKFGPRMCNIWVMKEYGINESWTQIFHIDRSLYGRISSILALTSTGKVLGLLINGAIVLVDPVKEIVECLGSAYSQTFVGPYVESLFFLNKNEPDVLSF